MRWGRLGLVLLALGGPGASIGGEPHSWEPASPVLGQLPLDQFPQVLPEWEKAALAYKPAPEAVEALKKAAPARIEAIFGSWCADSYDHLPPLIAAWRQAANPRLELVLIGVGRGRIDPEGIIPRRAIERFPTVVVVRDGEEIGRVVETPAATMEVDVARILSRAPAKP